MSEDTQSIEVITATARRRRRPTEEKLRIVEQTLALGETILCHRQTRNAPVAQSPHGNGT